MNDDETAFDYAVVVLDRGLGELTGSAGFRTFDKAWLNGQYWQNLGYPGDIGGDTKPSFSNSGAISSADGANPWWLRSCARPTTCLVGV